MIIRLILARKPHIPQEIMMEILLLLPFESILACRLAAKQFKNIIDDREFLNRYHGKPPLVLVARNNSLYCVMESNSDKITVEGFNHPPFKVRRIPTDTSHKFGNSLTRAAPNRIACVRTEEGNYFLYNLFTGATSVVEGPRGRRMMCYGSGYDHYDDDYKIVIAFGDNLFQVYSTRNSVWKWFDDFPCTTYQWMWLGHSRRPQACCYNGVLHWISYKREKQRMVIVTYDLHTCRFSELSLPSNCRLSYTSNLIELGGDLCFWYHKSMFHVYVMKEYGMEESWTKLFSINPSVFRSGAYIRNIEPTALCECKDGRRFVLFVCRHYGSLYWYDIGNDKVKVVHKHIWDKQRVVGGKKRKLAIRDGFNVAQSSLYSRT